MKRILTESIQYMLLFFVISITYQLIFKQQIEWGQTIMISISTGVVSFIAKWSNIPYNWKKK